MAPRDTQKLVSRIVDLPTLPQVVMTLMNLLDDPRSSVNDINRIMGNDPTLVAKLLKLVNSSFYGLPQRVASIPQAINILGFNTIKSLAISASVFDLFAAENDAFSYPAFWTQSVGVATISRHVARTVVAAPTTDATLRQRLNVDNVFVAGLLHGMGKLILDQYASEDFVAILDKAQEFLLSFADAEKDILDASNADIGSWLLSRWKMPEVVQAAVKFQNRVSEAPEEHRPAAGALAFAIYLTRLRPYGAAGDFDRPVAPKAAWEALKLDKDGLQQILAGLDEAFASADAFLALVTAP